MRKQSRRFPNKVIVWKEVLSNGRTDYTAERDGRVIGEYRVVTSRARPSGGILNGRGYPSFYDWLRAAREVR